VIVSHRHRFIFLKTRKTAGTSIELFLFPHCGEEDIVTPLTRTPLTRRVGHRARNHIRPAFPLDPRPAISRRWPLEGWKSVDFHDHIRAADVRRYVGEEVWNGYYKFAFERNVYDRQVSWYHYRTQARWKKRVWPDFASFLARFPGARMDNFEIYTIGGELAVDFVGRYENLAEDLAKVMGVLGLPMTGELPRAKADIRPEAGSYRDYYDDASRRLVESWYPGEIALFGHRF
jgi:hypothetical protein